MQSNDNLNSPYWALRFTFGAVPFLAGLDKFFNLLTHWDKYISPFAQSLLPVAPTTFMHVAGVIEMAVGIAILTRWTRIGSYIAAFWLAAIAINLILGGFFDIAVRDLAMAVGAYTLAKLSEARAAEPLGSLQSLRQATSS